MTEEHDLLLRAIAQIRTDHRPAQDGNCAVCRTILYPCGTYMVWVVETGRRFEANKGPGVYC